MLIKADPMQLMRDSPPAVITVMGKQGINLILGLTCEADTFRGGLTDIVKTMIDGCHFNRVAIFLIVVSMTKHHHHGLLAVKGFHG